VVQAGAEASAVTDADPLSHPTDPEVSRKQPEGPGSSASDTAEAAAEQVEADFDELEQAINQRDEYLQLAQRTQADFENFRKRKAREVETAEARGIARVAKELFPALDNLGRALSAAAEDDPLLAGVRLVHDDLVAALARLGIESFSPEGQPFDPVEHEAVAHTPVEGAAPGTVVEVYQAGYRANGNVLRPARVVVAA
jgi:molecular chaperone GrpE